MFIKRLPRFEYHAPGSVAEALDLLSRYGSDAKLVAGGTDLVIAMKKRTVAAGHLINLKTIPGLSGIRAEGQEIVIGALTTIADLERSSVIRENCTALWDAAQIMASPQVRTLATIGGNIVSSVPSADTAPPLMVLSAKVMITGQAGERTCPVEELFAGPSKCALAPTDMLTAIRIPAPNGCSVYLKSMRRAALDLALAGVAAYIACDGGKACTDVKIALGAVAPTPIRAAAAEKVVMGKVLTDDLCAQAGKVSATLCTPITDVRASKEYRCSLVEVLTKRALLQARNRLNQGGVK